MHFEPILKLVAVNVLYALLEFLIPNGAVKKSAATALRLSALLTIAGILVDWMG